jgi:hypothetical protein
MRHMQHLTTAAEILLMPVMVEHSMSALLRGSPPKVSINPKHMPITN